MHLSNLKTMFPNYYFSFFVREIGRTHGLSDPLKLLGTVKAGTWRLQTDKRRNTVNWFKGESQDEAEGVGEQKTSKDHGLQTAKSP